MYSCVDTDAKATMYTYSYIHSVHVFTLQKYMCSHTLHTAFAPSPGAFDILHKLR